MDNAVQMLGTRIEKAAGCSLANNPNKSKQLGFRYWAGMLVRVVVIVVCFCLFLFACWRARVCGCVGVWVWVWVALGKSSLSVWA